MDLKAELVFDEVAELGEGPLWSVREQSLYWVDALGRLVHVHDTLKGSTQTHKLSVMPGSLANRAGGGLMVAGRNGLLTYDPGTGSETRIACNIDFGVERFNDGKVDRRGRFFVGTMDKTLSAPIGALYRVDPDLSVTKVAADICLSNGLSWSPDNRILYHNDSRPGLVYAYDYDIESGTVSNRRIHIDFRDTAVHPDGSTVDAEGCLWIAEVGGWTVGRYDPEGKRMGGVRLPTQRVTSVMFGGSGLDTLFITTMRFNLTEAQLAAQPLAGRVFAVKPGVCGLPENDFTG